MLVLSRLEDQSLTFTTQSGETFTVKVSRIAWKRITLCIDAPLSVQVKRTELLEKGKEAAAA